MYDGHARLTTTSENGTCSDLTFIMSSPQRKSAFRAASNRPPDQRNSTGPSSERAPQSSTVISNTAPRKFSAGGKGTVQTDILKRRLERLKQSSSSQNGAKPQRGSPVSTPTIRDTRGQNGSNSISSNKRVSSPHSTPTPLNSSTPLFVRRMSDNDPRRHLIKSSVYSNRKASLPAQSPRSSIGPSPLAATDKKPRRTSKQSISEANESISQCSTHKTNSIHDKINAKSKRTRPNSSSPKTSIGQSSRVRTSRTTPRDSDQSRTSTPDQMVRVISQESLNETHAPSIPKDILLSQQNSSQKEDPSCGYPAGEACLGEKKDGNILDNLKHSNDTNMELELKSLKSESDSTCSAASDRIRKIRNNIKGSTRNEAKSEKKSSRDHRKKSSQMPEKNSQNESDSEEDPSKQRLGNEEEPRHQHKAHQDSSSRHENNLDVTVLETTIREVKVESQEQLQTPGEDKSDHERQRSSFQSHGMDKERLSDDFDPEVKGQRQREGSGFKDELEIHERLKTGEVVGQDHQASREEIREDEKGHLRRSSEVKGQSLRLRSNSRTKSQDMEDEADGLIRSIDGREDISPRHKVGSSSPRRDSAADKREKMRQRNSELAIMAKRLEQKAKEMQNRPTAEWKRTTGTENGPNTPLSPTGNTFTTTTPATTSPQKQPRPATSTGVVPDVEQMKRMMVKQQRAREMAESAQKALIRDRELEYLKQEVEALKKTVDISRQDQIIEGDLQRTLSNGSATIKLKTLEDANSTLKDKLQRVQEDSKAATQKLEVEVSQQRKTCEALERDLCEERHKSNQLALDLQQAVNQNAFLTKQLGDLHRKVSLLDQVLEECRQLREDFSEQRQILHSTIAERDWLRDSVVKLNSEVALMQASEEKRKQLERDYEEALRDLEQRQSEIRRLQMAQDEVMTQNRDVVSRLETKVQDLEKQWLETRQNSGRNAAELSGLRQQTHSQLQNLASSSSRSIPAHVSTTVKSKEAEKEDWRKIAEEALVARAPSQSTASASGPKPKLQDAVELPQGSEASQKSAARNGQTDSISEPGDLLDELSDKIDQVLLNKLHHASVSSGPISKLAVFIARYNYDPSQDSPNDNYDSELPLTAGDYIYVYGDPDEDGFYEGELMDGRRGLVPCNFIERIAEENLPDFMQYNGSQADDTDSSSLKIHVHKATPLIAKVPPIKATTTMATNEDTPKLAAMNAEQEDQLSDLEFNSEDVDAKHSNINHFSGDLGFGRPQSDHPSDLEDIPEVDEDDDNHHHHHATTTGRHGDEGSLASFSDFSSDVTYVVPCPRKLSLDRQLKHSVIMSWVAPDTVTLQEIQEFRVYVDGQYRTATKQGAKTRALVENIEPTGTYRISVRTVTAKGMSEEAACMLLIGRDASVAPTNLKASNVGPSSANISWLPGNSNLPHVISVNGVEERTVKPGIFKYSLAGLQPLSICRVSVRAKSRRQTAIADNPQASKNFVEIEFKTLPGDPSEGLPDAPLDIQVKQAINDSMVSVEWLPVTITTSSLSNGAVIMGYAVFVNNSKVAETMSPTADRVNIPKSKLRMLSAKELVVRTLSPNGCSNDSLPSKVPPELLEEQRKDKKNAPGGKRRKKVTFDDENPAGRAAMYANADDDDSSTSSASRSDRGRRSSDDDSQQRVLQKSALKTDGSKEDALPLKPIMKTEKTAILRESEFMSDSDRSELSDIQEEAEEDLSEFGSASLPGLSESSEGMRSSGRRRTRGGDEKKKVQETLQVLQYNTKPVLDFDTDPEVESLNKPDKVVPIPIIRSQRDYERETEQSPHNPVVEPVPWKPAKTVPQIEITKDANSEHLKSSGARKSDLYNPEKRTEVIGASPVSSISNSLPMASPRSDPRGQSRTQGQRSNSAQWNGSSVASSNSDAMSYGKNYDAKSNNDRHHHQADGRPHSDSSGHRRSDSSGLSERNRQRQHSDSLRTPESSLSLPRSSRGSRSEETFGDEDDEEGFSGSEPEELFDDGTIRYFIAIFDYNPAIMSPNIDGAEEELFLKEGDILKIIGDKDSDGFFVGEMNGRRGYVPCNMVEEIESPEQTPFANTHKRGGDTSQDRDRSRLNDTLNTTGSSQVNMIDGLSPNGQIVIPKDSTPHRMRALFDYNPQELSPNPDLDIELSFCQGDSIIVYGEMDEDGFFMGELRGKRGLVPSNFLEEVSDIDSSTTSRSYSPAFNRNKENRHQTPQSTKDKYAVPAQHQQQENGEAQYHSSEMTPVISDSAEQTSITSTPEHTKKKKGLLSKGKALFKKLGSSDNKPKHK